MLCGGLQNSLKNFPIEIDYPGVNNFSQFSYDGLSRNTKIVETVAGSVTSTKQFVWCQHQVKPSEERDGSSVVVKTFYSLGQLNGATKYVYGLDHLGSTRQMTDTSSNIQAQYAFDPFGRMTKITETVASDFGYADYYLHARSGLNSTLTRAYNANLGRFINRDSIQERGGTNLYAYVRNKPIKASDPVGTNFFDKMRGDQPWDESDEAFDIRKSQEQMTAELMGLNKPLAAIRMTDTGRTFCVNLRYPGEACCWHPPFASGVDPCNSPCPMDKECCESIGR